MKQLYTPDETDVKYMQALKTCADEIEKRQFINKKL